MSKRKEIVYDFDKYVYLKLNDNYSNAFLTTNHGEVFYRDWKEQNRPEFVAVEIDKYRGSVELRECVRMGMLKVKEPTTKENKKVEKVELETKKEPEKVTPTEQEVVEENIEKIEKTKNADSEPAKVEKPKTKKSETKVK